MEAYVCRIKFNYLKEIAYAALGLYVTFPTTLRQPSDQRTSICGPRAIQKPELQHSESVDENGQYVMYRSATKNLITHCQNVIFPCQKDNK